MKRLTPYISACLAIDASNSIAYDGKPVSHYAPKELRDLDFTILREYLRRSMQYNRPMYVIGEHTWNDMKGLPLWERIYSDSTTEVIVVCKDGVWDLAYDALDVVNLDKTRAKLFETNSVDSVRNLIVNKAINESRQNIFVLGGAKVYDSFLPIADEVFVGCYEQVMCAYMENRKNLDLDLYGNLWGNPEIATKSEGVDYCFYHFKKENNGGILND